MRGQLLICDGCKKESRKMTGEIGTIVTYDWLTLTRGASSSGDSVSAGEYNFCSEECLERWLRDISV